jgi:hypothetical protein
VALVERIMTEMAPIRFEPSMEVPEPDEEKTGAAIVAAMRSIVETTFKDYGRAVRAVHAKSHGLLQGTLTVLDGLAPELAQGLFAKPGSYDVVLRLSTNPGDILDDDVSTPRGLAVKVVGVDGERLPGSEGDRTQDFVLVNGPVFSAATAKTFLGNVQLLAKTTDTPQAWKKAFSALARGLEGVVETFGGESGTLKALGGHPLTNVLGETYYSQGALLYGPYMAKLSVAPVSPEIQALTGAAVDLAGKPNGLREAVLDHFRENGGEWEVRVQLRTDPDTMPIEDASVRWPENKSPYRPVARITVRPQTAWSEARARAVDDGLSFSPWHGLAAHRPLGVIMRVRKAAYEMSSGFRAEGNGCPIHEPQRLQPLPA